MDNGDLKTVYFCLCDNDLLGAMSAMQIYLSKHWNEADLYRLNAIRSDFELMTDYWKRGYKDPQIQPLYKKFLNQMYTLYLDVHLSAVVGASSYLSSIYTHLHMLARDWSFNTLRESLQSFVTESAMLELEQPHLRTKKQTDLYTQHHRMMNEWFEFLMMSTRWTDGQADEMEEILLSPTIESRDQQVIVSAMTISLIRGFDGPKFRTLLNVYQKVTDENVRQRALVGWAMSLYDPIINVLNTDEIALMHKLLENQNVCQELVQLQQQMIYCINAERDNMTIRNEIMPDLLKSSNYRVTINGIEEVDEETSLNDILHPDEEERRMEQMEESFRRMQNMQKEGADVYFGGFSQMKRFPFFQDIVNWFVPFYPEHPGIAEVTDKLRESKFLNYVLHNGPFCNSDKYSFALAYLQVVVRIPSQLKEVLESNEFPGMMDFEDVNANKVLIRRTYLQDLYRFYRIFPYKAEFEDLFNERRRLFFARGCFMHTHLETYFCDIVAFLIKQKRLEDAADVLANCGENRRDFRFYMMAGYLMSKSDDKIDIEGKDALYYYHEALKLQPESQKALQGYARALFDKECYKEALDAYDKLLAGNPDDRKNMINRSVCLMRLSRYQEAEKDLFRMNFETPDDKNVNRVLAWALTCDDKYDQAVKLYERLLSDSPLPDDMLNYGYCLWLCGRVADAIDCFHNYLKETEQDVSVILKNEQQLLMDKGITVPEKQMMLAQLQVSS